MIGKYRGRGIHSDEIRSAAFAGLVEASRKYDPQRGPFGPYARCWIKGEITALFKEAKRGRAESLDAPLLNNDRGDDPDKPKTIADALADEPPSIALDLSALSDTDRKIIEARNAGETLSEQSERGAHPTEGSLCAKAD